MTKKARSLAGFTFLFALLASSTALAVPIGIPFASGAATHFVVSGPASVTPGISLSPTVTAEDAMGNVDMSYLGTVHFFSTDFSAVLPPNYPFVSGDGGIHTFFATLFTLGPESINVVDVANGSITGTLRLNVVAAPEPATLALLGLGLAGLAATRRRKLN